jgi:hypothetical protein
MRGIWFAVVVAGIGVIGCAGARGPAENAQVFTAQDRAAVENGVRQFMSSVEQDVTREGPAAWAHEFSHEPTFFMVSDGVLLFPSGAAAAQGVQSLRQVIKKIELHWGGDLRIDALSPDFAVVGTSWQETREMQGREVKDHGYFTGLVEQANGKWQFRNAHWSTQKTGQAESRGDSGNK